MRSTLPCVALVLGLATGAAIPAYADSITYTDSKQFSASAFGEYLMGDTGPAIATLTDPLSLSKFDPGFGTLDSVQILLTGGFTADANGGSNGLRYHSVELDFDNASHVSLELPAPGSSLSVDTSAPLHVFGDQDVGTPGDPLYVGSGSVSASDSTTTTLSGSASDLAAYIGSGDLALNPTGQATSTYVSSASDDWLHDITGSIDVRVTYTYTPNTVPEPGSIALLVGLGISGSVFVRRRKNARQVI